MMRAVALLSGIVLGLMVSPPSHASADTAPAVVRIEMREFQFLPAVIRLPVGRPVRLRFVNRGQLAHQFEAGYLRTLPVAITDEGARVEALGLDFLRLQPGGTASLQFVPRRPGRYEFACTIEGHREAGMKGIILFVR
jgi:uncharacterized cupredoxin-like copper-binding protein